MAVEGTLSHIKQEEGAAAHLALQRKVWMSRKFESADPLRRGSRRPPAAALRKAAQKVAQPKPERPLGGPLSGSANLMQKQPPTTAQVPEFQEFALKMCTEEDVKDARYHILKFNSKKSIDPAGQFVPPIRLHRKDPRQLQVIAGEEYENEEEEEDVIPGADSLGGVGNSSAGGSSSAGNSNAGNGNAGNAGNANGANGANSANNGTNSGNGSNGGEEKPERKRPFGRRRKTRKIHGGDKNDAARKLRYEEHYPWVMEDFDNKNTWVSSFEAAQSNNFAILTYDPASNGFKVVPIEKVYRMTPSARYATLSLEDAEARMESSHSMRDRWLMSHLQPRVGSAGPGSPTDLAAANAAFSAANRMRTVVGSEERQHKYNIDEEMDYDDQEMFDDDEGAPILDGPEEDLKEAEDRIKREQLKANELMEAGRDDDIDELFDDEEMREGKQGKKLRKALLALEKNQYYDTDDEEHPYVSSADEADSDDELIGDGAGAGSGANEAGGNTTTNELGVPVKSEPDSAASADDAHHAMVLPPLAQFRRKHINRESLPRGMVVLQLPPETLSRFSSGLWNPQIKREASDMSPSLAASPGSPGAVEEFDENDPRLLTRDDVRRNIVSGETSIRQLLAALKPKLAFKVNQQLLRQYVKEVARSSGRKLYLRD